MNLTSQTLHQFVIDLHLDEIQTLDALLAQMTGDYAASRMLARLLYWRDKAIKFGGWVWKSWRDWRAECGLSQGQIKRVHRDGVLEQYGMARSLMKANGAPTTHYLLDEDAFIVKLADFLDMAFDEVKLRISIIANGESNKKKSRKGDVEYGSGEYASFINNFDQQPSLIPPEIKQEVIIPQEAKTEEVKPIEVIFEPHILTFAEETNVEPAIIARFDFDEAQSIWTHIKEDYPKSVKHWREHNDLLMHAFAGLPFKDVSAELIHRVQFNHDRNSYSSYYRPTVRGHSSQLHKFGLR